MTPEEINRLAEKEKQKSVKSSKPAPAPKPFIPSSAESWKVYSQIYPHYVNVLVWIFLVFTSGFVCLVLVWSGMDNVWLLRCGLALVGLTFIRYIIHFIVKVSRFSHYKNWQKNLGFVVTGWNHLGEQKDFPKSKFWIKLVTVDVKTEGNINLEQKKSINNALYLLIKEANKCFYESDGFGGESRREWMFNNELTVAGSANAAVIGEIYLCVDKYLRSIHNSYKVIKQVDLTFEGTPTEISPKDTGD